MRIGDREDEGLKGQVVIERSEGELDPMTIATRATVRGDRIRRTEAMRGPAPEREPGYSEAELDEMRSADVFGDADRS